MTSQKQIEANRRNARSSTGPRSNLGKKRSSGNAYRHGLSLPLSGLQVGPEVDALARRIAGSMTDRITLEHARVAAEAELELARIRKVRAGLIQLVGQLGILGLPEQPWMERLRFIAMTETLADEKRQEQRLLRFMTAKATMPTTEPERSDEATRRILTDLKRLYRYEARAVSRRDRAIRSIFQAQKASKSR